MTVLLCGAAHTWRVGESAGHMTVLLCGAAHTRRGGESAGHTTAHLCYTLQVTHGCFIGDKASSELLNLSIG
jgi:hypothetical protein